MTIMNIEDFMDVEIQVAYKGRNNFINLSFTPLYLERYGLQAAVAKSLADLEKKILKMVSDNPTATHHHAKELKGINTFESMSVDPNTLDIVE